MGRRLSGNGGGAPRARTIAVSVPLSSGVITTLSRFGLLAPVSYAKTSGSSNLTISATTGAISAASALTAGAVQTLGGTATGGDGVLIPFVANCKGVALVTAPAAPALVLTGGSGQVSIAWTDGATGGAPISAHNFYRATASGAEVLVGAITTASPFIDAGLVNGTAYFYKLSAVNSAGESALSGEQTATPTAATGVPAAPAIVLTRGNGQITLAWTDGSDGGSPITGHKLYRGLAANAETLIGTITTASPYIDTGLSNGTAYFYKLSAVSANGEGALSSEATTSPATVPDAPSITVSAGNAQASIAFADPGSNGGAALLGHKLYRSATVNFTTNAANLVATFSTASPYVNTGLANGTTYYFKVRSVNAAGDGPVSNEVSATPAAAALVTVNPYLGQVATRGYLPNAVTTGVAAKSFRTLHVARQALVSGSTVRVIYPLWWVDAGNATETMAGKELGSSDASIALNVEYPQGTVVGSASGSATGGNTVVLDVVLGATVPEGATFHLVPTVSASGGGIPYTAAASFPMWGVEANDQFYPAVIAATTNRPAFALIGNSRQVGNQGATNAGGDNGETAPSIGSRYAYANFGVATDRIYWLVRYRRRLALLSYFTHVVHSGPINDSRYVRARFSAAQINADLALFAELTPGKALIYETSAPAQESATAIDQADAVRLAVNSYMRTAPAPVNAAIDLARMFDATDDGLWDNASFTADYIHQNPAGYAAIAGSGLIAADAIAAMVAQPRLWSPTASLIGAANLGAIFDFANPSCIGRQPTGTGTLYDAVALNAVSGLAQATAAKKPVLTAAAIGSRQGYVFTAANAQELPSGTSARAMLNGAGGAMIHAIIKPGAATGATMAFGFVSTNASATAPRMALSVASTGAVRLAVKRIGSDASYSLDSATVLTVGNVYIVTGTINTVTGAAEIRINGASDITAAATWTSGLGTFEALDALAVSVGSTSAASYFNGAIGMVDIIAGQRTADELLRLEGRTAYDWGQQGLLPAAHPYKSAPPMAG